jgi:hypothetical protein
MINVAGASAALTAVPITLSSALRAVREAGPGSGLRAKSSMASQNRTVTVSGDMRSP